MQEVGGSIPPGSTISLKHLVVFESDANLFRYWRDSIFTPDSEIGMSAFIEQ